MCIMNVANMGKFSSDRAIREYAEQIWQLRPCPVALPDLNAPDAKATIG